MPTVAGIDVGAQRLHCVALREGSIITELFSASALDDLVTWLRGSECVAVDSPDRLSLGYHEAELELSAKFRVARCAEIALGREHRMWVPWVTPRTEPLPGWMRVGMDVFVALAEAKIPAIEVYPHACFHRLGNGRRLPKKTTLAGSIARAGLLRRSGIEIDHLRMWSHDVLDAAVATVTARDQIMGTAISASCGHDGSALWLPAQIELTDGS